MALDRSNKSPARNRCDCRFTYIDGNWNISASFLDGKQVRRIWSRINPARIREREQFGDLIKPINSAWCNDHRETSNIWERAVVTRIHAVAVDFQAVPESLWPGYYCWEGAPHSRARYRFGKCRTFVRTNCRRMPTISTSFFVKVEQRVYLDRIINSFFFLAQNRTIMQNSRSNMETVTRLRKSNQSSELN